MRAILLAITLLSIHLCTAQPFPEKAKVLLDARQWKELKDLAVKVGESSPDFAAAQYYLGRVAFSEKNYDDAADYFEEAAGKNPKSSEYFTWLGDTYGTIAQSANVIRQGFLAPKMKSAWEKAIALDDKNINARFSLVQYYTQAPSMMGGSMEKAHEMANQMKAINKAQGFRAEGNIFVKEKKIQEAEKAYLQMVEADPAFSNVLANFYFNQKMYNQAFSIFDSHLKANPNDMVAAYQLGKAAALSGQRLDQGEQLLKQYLTYQPKPGEPSWAGAHMRLGQIYEKRARKAEAKKHFEEALRMDATLEEAREGLQRTSK